MVGAEFFSTAVRMTSAAFWGVSLCLRFKWRLIELRTAKCCPQRGQLAPALDIRAWEGAGEVRGVMGRDERGDGGR